MNAITKTAAEMNLPRGFFYLGPCLCRRLEQGGWRVASAADRMDCEELIAAAFVKMQAEAKAAAGAKKK